jgi:hypothetical protein
LEYASKAIESTYTEYQITFSINNKKYKSLLRVASNNVDFSEINFSEIVEISLDNYKLDQFDQMFIMNYQKMSISELNNNSQARLALNYLLNNQHISSPNILGIAFKPNGLGFLYQIVIAVGQSRQLSVG